ncbi:MAG: hypothetical protein ACD_52C00134G0002 [uncultured bacterium]|nr:MAG: hypothetical protein ACD_52C00134G0002 [uncultured bacterium]
MRGCYTENRMQKGQTFLGFLISVAILTILSSALFTLVLTSYELITFTRARVTARHIAQQKMENVRNLPYDTIGTVGGIPTGTLAQIENTVQNGLNYRIKTDIVYVDDPFDNVAPTDLLPTDYKRIRVDVSWEGLAESDINPVTMITDIAPKGLETAEGGGTLSILVFNANAQPVDQAAVTISATETTPQINLNLMTNQSGRVILPGAPICNSCYQITVTKEGYSSDRTYSTLEVANPLKPRVTVLEGQVSEVSFAIDRLSAINISTLTDRANGFINLPNVEMTLRGNKTIGTDVADFPVYKYEEGLTTDANGQLTAQNLEWDNYTIILSETSPFDITGTNPLNPFTVDPAQTLGIDVALTSHTDNNLLLVFTDQADNLLENVDVTLSDGAGFEKNTTTGLLDTPDFGQAFFGSLENKTYTIDATITGFLPLNGNFPVSAQTVEKIILTPE